MSKQSLSDMAFKKKEETKVDLYDLNISAEKAAAKINCHVVKPEANQLQLDIDNEEAFDTYVNRVTEYIKHSGLTVYQEVHYSKSGYPNRHITLTVTDAHDNPYVFDEWERLALQFALGSDPIRETLNSWRLLTGSSNPSRLFEPNEE